MINQVIIAGRLVREVSFKVTEGGLEIANFTLAVNRIKKGETDFLNCVAFGKTATAAANYTKKGQLISVIGEIQTRNYEKDGKKIYITEIIANRVQFLEFKGTDQDTSSEQQNNTPDPFAVEVDPDSLPF